MIVYLITNTLNGKTYVGQTTKTARHRWSTHKAAAKLAVNQYPIARAIRKYGSDNFTFEVLEEPVDFADLDMAERFWIRCYASQHPKGYNLQSGGHKQHKHSEESKRKMSASQRLRPPPSQETKDKISAAQKGRLGVPMSDAAKLKISDARTGVPMSEAAKKKLSARYAGGACRFSKLDWEQVRLIRSRRKDGVKVVDLAVDNNVSIQAIYGIINEDTWIESKQ
jgi:group I intron endonuclease